GFPLCQLKSPTSRKGREKWGTQIYSEDAGHPAKPEYLATLFGTLRLGSGQALETVPFLVEIKSRVKDKRAGVPAPHDRSQGRNQNQGPNARIGVSAPHEQNHDQTPRPVSPENGETRTGHPGWLYGSSISPRHVR